MSTLEFDMGADSNQMSSGSDSDEEYVPGEPEQLSEEGSADEETNLQYERELEVNTNKRKAVDNKRTKKKRKTKNIVKDTEDEPEVKTNEPEPVNPQEDKKREDDLWAMFLDGTGTKPKCSASETKVETKVVDKKADLKVDGNKTENLVDSESKKKEDNQSKEKRIFEFAGETIVVENNVIKEKIKTDSIQDNKPGVSTFKGRSSGGLSSLLGQINKKNKLSTLEKSKLDWETYKKDEGIEEEVQSHNKGKKGYLDRQDFLERADHRQYEIERDLRMSKRNQRH